MLNAEAANEATTFYAHKAMRLEVLLAQQQQAVDHMQLREKQLIEEVGHLKGEVRRLVDANRFLAGAGEPVDIEEVPR